MGRFYTGLEGSLTVNGVKIGKVRDWSFSGDAEAIETTHLGEYGRQYIAGRQSHAGSCSLFWYANSNGEIEGRPLIGALLRTGHVSPTERFTFRLESSNMALEFQALVTHVETGVSPGDVMQASVAFTVCGELSEVNLGGI